ncbi:MAG: intradiol ring-cleavage dioxygenase [Chloroflexia bacterium]
MSQDHELDNDDEQKGRILSRREVLALIGSAGAVLLGGVVVRSASASPLGSLLAQAPTAITTATATLPACVVRPALTEGPYFVDERLNRSDIRANTSDGVVSQGVPLQITFRVTNITDSCTPLAGAMVDVWHCDALGVYSEFGSGAGDDFLRGFQTTDANGIATFTTVYPGWYQGRAVHIHFKIRTDPDKNTGYEFTSQFFFNESITDVVHAQQPYAAKGTRTLKNSGDGIYNSGGSQLILNTVKSGDGYATTFDIGLQVGNHTLAKPVASGEEGHTFTETGFAVTGAVWTAWQAGRTFEDSVYINGYPITALRDEKSTTDGKTYKTQWFERARFELHPENAAPNNVLLGLLGTAAAAGRSSETPFKAVANPGGVTWYASTDHTLGDTTEGGLAIAKAWTNLGGLSQFGYPISQPFTEKNKSDGKSYLVQYFERQRFEYHPENKGTKFEVLLGRLGAEQVK